MNISLQFIFCLIQVAILYAPMLNMVEAALFDCVVCARDVYQYKSIISWLWVSYSSLNWRATDAVPYATEVR